MAIIGAHTILYSTNAEADRAFLRDVANFSSVDVGGGWLVFALPPSEVAVHPGDGNVHELYLMVDDVNAFVEAMASRGVTCTAPSTAVGRAHPVDATERRYPRRLRAPS